MAWTLQHTKSVPNGLYNEFTPVLEYFFDTFLPTYASDSFTVHSTVSSSTDRWWFYEYTVQCMTGESESFKACLHYEGTATDMEAILWNSPDATAGDTTLTNMLTILNDTGHSRTTNAGDYLFYTGENGAFMVLGPGASTPGYNDVVIWWPGPNGWIYQGEPNPDDRFHFFPFMDSYAWCCRYGAAGMYGPLAPVWNSSKVLISDLVGFSIGKGGIQIASFPDWYVPRLMWMAPPTENNYKLKWHTRNILGPAQGTPGHVILDDGKYWLDFYKGSPFGLLTLVGDTPLTLPYPE